MSERRAVPVSVVSVLVALTANVLLDRLTDLPMLARWGLALAAALVATYAVSRVLDRGRAGRPPGDAPGVARDHDPAGSEKR